MISDLVVVCIGNEKVKISREIAEQIKNDFEWAAVSIVTSDDDCYYEYGGHNQSGILLKPPSKHIEIPSAVIFPRLKSTPWIYVYDLPIQMSPLPKSAMMVKSWYINFRELQDINTDTPFWITCDDRSHFKMWVESEAEYLKWKMSE